MILVGADENGLGPALGPMVTSAVTLEVNRYDRKRLLAAGLEVGIDDSKNTAGFSRMAAAESLALALAEQLTGQVPRDVDAFFDSVGLHDTKHLKRRCPSRSKGQCWAESLPLPCFKGKPEEGRAALEGLRARGVEIRRARSALACAHELNTQLLAGVSRVELDLELMERLILDARDFVGEELTAVCGMVGGIRSYPTKMRHLSRSEVTVLAGRKGALRYAIRGVGEVRFEVDADARHLPVALSSMLGKYVRELWMERQNRFYRRHDPSLAAVSGYHDPKTRAFITASTPLRARLGIDADCFERMNAKHVAQRNQLPLLDL